MTIEVDNIKKKLSEFLFHNVSHELHTGCHEEKLLLAADEIIANHKELSDPGVCDFRLNRIDSKRKLNPEFLADRFIQYGENKRAFIGIRFNNIDKNRKINLDINFPFIEVTPLCKEISDPEISEIIAEASKYYTDFRTLYIQLLLSPKALLNIKKNWIGDYRFVGSQAREVINNSVKKDITGIYSVTNSDEAVQIYKYLHDDYQAGEQKTIGDEIHKISTIDIELSANEGLFGQKRMKIKYWHSLPPGSSTYSVFQELRLLPNMFNRNRMKNG